MLVGRALKGRRDQAFIQVKFGAQRDPSGAWIGYDVRPGAVKTALAYTLKRLGTDHIDLYQPARRDPAVPLEDTLGAVADMIRAGYVRHLGLSEVSGRTLLEAEKIHHVAALQHEYSVIEREVEADQLPALRRIGAGMTAYGVLSRGLLSSSRARPGDMRAHMPRFQPDNLARNQPLVDAFAAIAVDKGCTPVQLATAWVLSRDLHVIPLMGSRTRAQLADVIGALEVEITPEDQARIDAAIPEGSIAGTRYAEAQMRQLDL
jgi:aryl-alcohol dehydrogenase-like predicted oxidoreductase